MYPNPLHKRQVINSFTAIQERNESLNSVPPNLNIANTDRNRNGAASTSWMLPTPERGSEPLNTYLITQPVVQDQKRPVIPSKRAAQNRAAQKAFRQRREQYIKDLEAKVKQMDNWKEQLDTLRKENNNLKGKIVDLEKQVDVLDGELHKSTASVGVMIPSFNQQQRSMSLPTIPSNQNENNNSSSLMERAIVNNSKKRSYSESNSRRNMKTIGVAEDNTLNSLSHQTGFNNQLYNISEHTNSGTTNNDNKRRKVTAIAHQESIMTGQLAMHMAPSSRHSSINNNNNLLLSNNNNHWNNNDFEFDPFFQEQTTGSNEFVPTTGGEVLDDLFAMLQTRQRPQIPMLPAADDLNKPM